MTTLFDELQIGSMTLKNRTFMAPMSLGYGDQTGIPTLQEQAYWIDFMLLANSFQKLLSAILSFPHAPFSDALTAFPPICFIQSAIDSHFRCRFDHLTYFALHTTQCRSRHQLSMPRAYSYPQAAPAAAPFPPAAP